MFGFFEPENDPEVAAALLDAAEGWLRERGRERMLGPMDFTTNDECGLLIEGYDEPPMILQPWHPPLLPGAGRGAGHDEGDGPADVGALDRPAQGGQRVHPMIHAAAEKVAEEHGRRDPQHAQDATWRPRSGASWRSTTRPGATTGASCPITEEEVRFQAKKLKPVLDEDWAFIAEKDGEVVGAALTLPDINQVLAKMNGRLLPFGWWQFLRRKRKIDRRARVRPRRQARVPAPRRRRRASTSSTSRPRHGSARQGRADGLDPRDERADEPRDGGDGRQGRQALPALRAAACRAAAVLTPPRPQCGLSGLRRR